jgi:NAD(P)-dependent dehydrogenase (short-subunit alcohol dehydrogenase family)
MMQIQADNVAVVTGGASGIGLGIARALVARGAQVVIADIEEGAAQRAVDDLKSGGARALAVRCDVAERSSVEALADRAWSEFGHVDIAVNNAGVMPPLAPLIDLGEDDARWVLDVDVLGVLNGCAVFGRRFIEQGTPSHIVNTGSENSLGMVHTHAAIYTASKHAVLGLSDVFRNELPSHVGMSILCPGVVPTDLMAAGRNRPERYGGPVELPADAAPSTPDGIGLSPDEVGTRVVQGIERGDFYIVTHPPVREIVEERAEEILAAFDKQAPRFDGDDHLDTRAIVRGMGGL